jgi:hypothetical protein
MFQNIGMADKVIRIIAGLAIGILGLSYHSWLGLIGIVPLLTAGVGVCPLYLPFGISTRKPEKAKKA